MHSSRAVPHGVHAVRPVQLASPASCAANRVGPSAVGWPHLQRQVLAAGDVVHNAGGALNAPLNQRRAGGRLGDRGAGRRMHG